MSSVVNMFWLLFLICLMQFAANEIINEEGNVLQDVNFDHQTKSSQNSSSAVFPTHDATLMNNSTSRHDGFVENCSTSMMELANYTLLETVTKAVDSLLNFFLNNYQQMNLDAVISTRMVEGQLKVLLSHIPLNLETDIKNDVRRNIRRLIAKAKEICKVAIPIRRAKRPNYFQLNGGLSAEGFWEVYLRSKLIFDNVTEKKLGDSNDFTENFSDKCLAELLGSTGVGKPCNISDECWKFMTKADQGGYYVTHQVLYFLIGQQAGCEKKMKSRAEKDGTGSLESKLASLCNSVRKDAQFLVSKGLFDGYSQDVFMEQGAYCGIAGFRNFFQDEWLQKILSWQSSSGCYKLPSVWESDFRLGARPDLQNFQVPSASSKPLPPTTRIQRSTASLSRVRRENRLMAGGCAAHETGLAAVYIVMCIRFILEAMELCSTTGSQK